MIRFLVLPFLLSLIFGCQDNAEEISLPEVVDFNQHIRPILSNNCFVCHGPDISSRKADLRLDQESFAKAKTKSGTWPIREGNVRKSEVYVRINTNDPELMMPPPETNRTLSAYEKGLIARWIEQGAEWKKHWAFIPPTDPDLTQASHPIDQIIDKELSSSGLQRSKKADNQSLIRRSAFVLTGLPPETQDLNLNVNDPEIFNSYVDKLISSPRYGERWARHWMDLARYAEGRGHEFDYPVIGAWQYRDYLIRAFNDDLPYNQFVIEQLAGDLVADPRINPDKHFNESTIGTVFLNLSEGKHSPVDTKDEEKIRIDNVIDVTSKTFLGLTVACSRCHDHKFDDIPTTDYYSLYGIFESTRAHLYPTYATPDYGRQIDSIKSLKEELNKYLNAISGNSTGVTPAFISEREVNRPQITFKTIGDFRGESFGDWSSDGYCFGDRTTFGSVVVNPVENKATIVHSGVASSQIFSRGLSGALRSPTFTIENDYILFRAAGKNSSMRIVMDNLQLIQDPIHGAFSRKVDNPELTDYISYVGQWKGNKAYIEILPGTYYAKNGKNHHYRLDPEDWIEVAYVLTMDSLIEFSSEELWPDQQNFKSDQLHGIPKDIWKDYLIRKGGFSRTLVDTLFYAGMTEGDLIESPVFIRGDHRNLSEEKIPHRFLTALKDIGPEFPKKGSGRLALAEAIVDPKNPLTARVMVNRIWHHLFGKGLVTTVDNFGLQGTLPSHPKLLDHLALWFIDHNWSVKALIKYIVISETFQQGTEVNSDAVELDPENKLLHSYPVRRLEAEAIRDAILACSGSLELTMYGESVPMHLTDFLQGRGRPSISGPLDGGGRRSIYQALWRNFLPPFMTTFDMPIPFSTFGDRSETNVPAQSLTLLNDPFVKQQAEIWARNILALNLTEENRIKQIYLIAFNRSPTSEELKIADSFIRDQKDKYQKNEDKQVLVWTDFCHSIFNMKEFIYLL